MAQDDGLEFTLDGKTTRSMTSRSARSNGSRTSSADRSTQVDLSSIKVVSRFITVIKRRDNPDFTLDDARATEAVGPQRRRGRQPGAPYQGFRQAKGRRQGGLMLRDSLTDLEPVFARVYGIPPTRCARCRNASSARSCRTSNG
jgi:hypothetical protein